MTDITAIILTKNEEVNIERCINSIKNLVDRIVVVDSGSTDQTVEIAKGLGAEILHHEPFLHYANQFNWALDNSNIRTKWVYRIDADEVVTPELAEEIIEACKMHSEDDVNGLVMKFKVSFMGRFLTHGGIYPFYNLTIFKFGKGRYEDRAMGEHVILSEGRTVDLKNDCLHYDFKSLDAWISKHNWYATREVNDYLARKEAPQAEASALYHEASKAIKLRDGLYYKLPKFFRAKLYFWYRYYLKLGFLDGPEGRVHAFLQAYWYRYLVDAKIMEYEIRNKQMKSHKEQDNDKE
ncbi:MAG: glycosyltransferase family 2 protein [Odoribacter sp.]|nr:glycosyltransferase family 2 protein [Odoribacter sp.]